MSVVVEPTIEGPIHLPLTRMPLVASTIVTYEMLEDLVERGEVETVDDMMLCGYRSELRSYVVALPDVEWVFKITVHATWWDHWKAEHSRLSRFFRLKPGPGRRIEERVRIFKAVCPHVRLDRPRDCLLWLNEENQPQ